MQWENWNLAQCCSKIYFDFSVEIKDGGKHTHKKRTVPQLRAFRGESICHHGQNKSSTKWNKCLWGKMCYSRERIVFLFPHSLFSFCPFNVPSCSLSIHKRCMDWMYPLGRSFVRKHFQNKSVLLVPSQQQNLYFQMVLLASFFLESATLLLVIFQAVNIHPLKETTTLFYHYKS